MNPGALTLEKLRSTIRAFEAAVPQPPVIERIVVTPYAVRLGGRSFPASRHRSRRIHEKLVRRFGGEFQRIPAIMKVGGVGLLVHPSLWEQVKRLLPVMERGSSSLGIPVIFQ